MALASPCHRSCCEVSASTAWRDELQLAVLTAGEPTILIGGVGRLAGLGHTNTVLGINDTQGKTATAITCRYPYLKMLTINKHAHHRRLELACPRNYTARIHPDLEHPKPIFIPGRDDDPFPSRILRLKPRGLCLYQPPRRDYVASNIRNDFITGSI